MLQETRMGASRADALRALDERTQVDDLRTFVMAMLLFLSVKMSRLSRESLLLARELALLRFELEKDHRLGSDGEGA